MDSLLRQLTMLRHIPRLPRKITASALRDILEEQGFSTTLRTVQRDLEKLEQYFPFVADKHKPAGWAFTRDARQIDLPGMEPKAALVFRMVGLHLANLLPKTCNEYLEPYYQQADKILEETAPSAPGVLVEQGRGPSPRAFAAAAGNRCRGSFLCLPRPFGR